MQSKKQHKNNHRDLRISFRSFLPLDKYTNRANTPELKSGDQGQEDHIDLYGITASISRFTRSSAMTFGVNYAYGEGEAQPVDNTTVYDATANSLTFYLSGSFNY